MRTLLIVAASAGMLAGCGGGGSLQSNPGPVQPAAVGATAALTGCVPAWLPTPRIVPCRPNKEASWMSPAAAGPLLYVSDIGAEDVDVFSYPGGKQVGTLTGFSEPAGLCTDRKGDVFVVDSGNDRILEYAHGGT